MVLERCKKLPHLLKACLTLFCLRVIILQSHASWDSLYFYVTKSWIKTSGNIDNTTLQSQAYELLSLAVMNCTMGLFNTYQSSERQFLVRKNTFKYKYFVQGFLSLFHHHYAWPNHSETEYQILSFLSCKNNEDLT